MTTFTPAERKWLIDHARASFLACESLYEAHPNPETAARQITAMLMEGRLIGGTNGHGVEPDEMNATELGFCRYAVRGMWKFAAASIKVEVLPPVGVKARRRQMRFYRALYMKLGGNLDDLKLAPKIAG